MIQDIYEIQTEIDAWSGKAVSLRETHISLSTSKKGLAGRERDRVEHQLLDLHKEFETLYQEGISLIYTSLIKIGKTSGGINEAQIAYHLMLYALDLSNTFHASYQARPHNTLSALLSCFGKIKGAMNGTYLYRPVVPLDQLGIEDELIVRALFLYNGIVSVGELESVVNTQTEILGFGQIRLDRCKAALDQWRTRNRIDKDPLTALDRSKLVEMGNGLWRTSVGMDQGYFIELHPEQVHRLSSEVPLAILYAGSGLALARLVQV